MPVKGKSLKNRPSMSFGTTKQKQAKQTNNNNKIMNHEQDTLVVQYHIYMVQLTSVKSKVYSGKKS